MIEWIEGFDFFEFIDSFQNNINLLWNFTYLRKVVLLFSLSMIPLWALLGWDSGLGMIEQGIGNFPNFIFGNITFTDWITNIYSVYGVTFHFSSFVIYGLLFVSISFLLENLGIKHSRNVVFSGFLTLLNVGAFECWYMASFAYFQMNRNILEWFTTDFMEPPVIMNFSLLILGLLICLFVWAESYKLNNGEIVGRNFHFKPEYSLIILALCGCFLSILLWYFYPLPISQITINDWTSSTLFPQTHYAYMQSPVHVKNDILHLINVMTKIMFAMVQYFILRVYKNVHVD